MFSGTFSALAGRLPRLGRFPRLCVVGICLLLALDSALGAKHAAGAPAATVGTLQPVVVAARNLPAGHLISRRDVTVTHWPAALVPGDVRTGPAAVVGRRVATAVVTREALTGDRLIGTDLTLGLAPGFAAVPVPLDDQSAAELVRPGDRVDLLAAPRPPDPLVEPAAGATPASTGRVTTVAGRALVLAVPPADPTIDATAGGAIVLAMTRGQALRITRDRSTHLFTVVGDPP